MRKVFSRALLIIMLVGGLILVSDVHFDTVKASTDVMGIIASDTTWTQANSPYNLAGNVLVNSGVTLTIETGTTLNTNDYYIRVNGTMIIQSGVTINLESASRAIQVNGVLTARGTSTNPIHVNGVAYSPSPFIPSTYSSIVFSQSSIGWDEQTGSGCIIEDTIFSQTDVTIRNSLKLTECTFVDNSGIIVYGGSPVISKNEILGIIDIKGGSPTISNNNFSDGCIAFYGEDGGEFVSIVDNIISGGAGRPSGSSTCIWFGGSHGYGGHVLIERNLITNSYYGIFIFSPNFNILKTSLTIQNNTITNNEVGISVKNPHSPTITRNNIYGNSINIELSRDASKDITATYNWWGTTDTQTISQLIVDFEDNLFDLGTVDFIPFLTEPNPEEMSTPIPEFPSWIILPLLLTSTLLVILCRQCLNSKKVTKEGNGDWTG